MRAQILARLLAGLVGVAGGAATVPRLEVADTGGHPHSLPDPRLPELVVYGDRGTDARDAPARAAIGRVTDRADNRHKLELFAVADVERWDWWPARQAVVAELRKIERREKTTLYCDWTGQARRAFGLERGQSAIVLVAPSGRVLFAAAEPLSQAELRLLLARLHALGVRP